MGKNPTAEKAPARPPLPARKLPRRRRPKNAFKRQQATAKKMCPAIQRDELCLPFHAPGRPRKERAGHQPRTIAGGRTRQSQGPHPFCTIRAEDAPSGSLPKNGLKKIPLRGSKKIPSGGSSKKDLWHSRFPKQRRQLKQRPRMRCGEAGMPKFCRNFPFAPFRQIARAVLCRGAR